MRPERQRRPALIQTIAATTTAAPSICTGAMR